jgi:hypothetical protein
VAMDHSNQQVIVAIRGTQSLHDACTRGFNVSQCRIFRVSTMVTN